MVIILSKASRSCFVCKAYTIVIAFSALQFTAKVFWICLSALLGHWHAAIMITEVEMTKVKKLNQKHNILLHDAFILE